MAIQNDTKSADSDDRSNVLAFNSSRPKKPCKEKNRDLSELMEINRNNQDRLKKERAKANLSVIRTHQLKK